MLKACKPGISKGFKWWPHQLNCIIDPNKEHPIYRWLWWNWWFEG